jgi:hypothetical protein
MGHGVLVVAVAVIVIVVLVAGDVFENGNDNTQAYFQEHGCSEEMLATLSTLVVRSHSNPPLVQGPLFMEDPPRISEP